MDNDYKYSGCHELVPVTENALGRAGVAASVAPRSARAAQVFCLLGNRVCVLQTKKLVLWLKGLLQTMLCFLVREFVVLHSWLIFKFSLLYKHKGINEVESTVLQLVLVKFLPLFHEHSSKNTDLVEIFLKKFSFPGLSIGTN